MNGKRALVIILVLLAAASCNGRPAVPPTSTSSAGMESQPTVPPAVVPDAEAATAEEGWIDGTYRGRSAEFAFKSTCESGVCVFALPKNRMFPALTFQPQGSEYVAHKKFSPNLPARVGKVTIDQTFTVQPTEGALVDGVWHATRLSYTIDTKSVWAPFMIQGTRIGGSHDRSTSKGDLTLAAPKTKPSSPSPTAADGGEES